MPVVIDARMAFAKLKAVNATLNQETLLRSIGLRLIGWTMENFKKEGIEEPWKPLSASTIARRRKKSSKPLQDTGTLRASWTTAAGNPKIVGNTVSVTSNVKYAPFHEFGTRPRAIQRKKSVLPSFHPGIPKRKMAPSKKMAEELALSVINAAIDRKLKGMKKK